MSWQNPDGLQIKECVVRRLPIVLVVSIVGVVAAVFLTHSAGRDRVPALLPHDRQPFCQEVSYRAELNVRSDLLTAEPWQRVIAFGRTVVTAPDAFETLVRFSIGGQHVYAVENRDGTVRALYGTAPRPQRDPAAESTDNVAMLQWLATVLQVRHVLPGGQASGVEKDPNGSVRVVYSSPSVGLLVKNRLNYESAWAGITAPVVLSSRGVFHFDAEGVMLETTLREKTRAGTGLAEMTLGVTMVDRHRRVELCDAKDVTAAVTRLALVELSFAPVVDRVEPAVATSVDDSLKWLATIGKEPGRDGERARLASDLVGRCSTDPTICTTFADAVLGRADDEDYGGFLVGVLADVQSAEAQAALLRILKTLPPMSALARRTIIAHNFVTRPSAENAAELWRLSAATELAAETKNLALLAAGSVARRLNDGPLRATIAAELMQRAVSLPTDDAILEAVGNIGDVSFFSWLSEQVDGQDTKRAIRAVHAMRHMVTEDVTARLLAIADSGAVPALAEESFQILRGRRLSANAIRKIAAFVDSQRGQSDTEHVALRRSALAVLLTDTALRVPQAGATVTISATDSRLSQSERDDAQAALANLRATVSVHDDAGGGIGSRPRG